MRIEGREALRAFSTDLFERLPDYFGRFDGVAYGEDSAVVWGHWGGTTPEGRRVEVPVTLVCTFRDGLLAGERVRRGVRRASGPPRARSCSRRSSSPAR